MTTVPLVLGVGISTPAQAVALAPLADGLIVGSVLVRRVLEAPSTSDAAMAAGALVVEFSTALQGNGSAGR